MAYVTDTQLARINRIQAAATRAKVRAEEKAGEILDGAEIIGAATLMGFLRGYVEHLGYSFTIPSTSIDGELLLGVGLVGLGLSDALGDNDNHALMTGYGILAAYSHQITRKFAASNFKEFSVVAGDDFARVGGFASVNGAGMAGMGPAVGYGGELEAILEGAI